MSFLEEINVGGERGNAAKRHAHVCDKHAQGLPPKFGRGHTSKQRCHGSFALEAKTKRQAVRITGIQ